MKFNKYAKQLAEFGPTSHRDEQYYAVALAGEVGEVCNEIKKLHRDNDGFLDGDRSQNLEYELGDCLYYLNRLAETLGLTLEQVARSNLEKLKERNKAGRIVG